MTERVGKSSLAVNAPGPLMVSDVINRAVRAGSDSAGDERIGVITEDLDPDRGATKRSRVPEPAAGRFVQKERRPFDLQADNAAKTPELGRTKRVFIPVGSDGR